MRSLTDFQLSTERALVEELATIGFRLTNYELAGEHESYIRSGVSETPLELLIYEDEAGIRGPGIDERFQAPDYESAPALALHFVTMVVELAKRSRSIV